VCFGVDFPSRASVKPSPSPKVCAFRFFTVPIDSRMKNKKTAANLMT